MHQASVGFHCPACTKSGAQKTISPFATRGGNTPFVYSMLALIVAAFLAQLISGRGDATSGWMFENLVLFGPYIDVFGDYWRIVTGAFLHSNIVHILFNSYFIYSFGSYLERQIGSLRTALIYFGALLSGSAAVLLFSFATPVLGASGAALGMGGGAVALMAANGQNVADSPLARVLLLNLVLPLLGFLNISFWGHFGGVAGGLIVGAILGYLPRHFGQSDKTTKLAAGLAVVVLGLIAVVAGVSGDSFTSS